MAQGCYRGWAKSTARPSRYVEYRSVHLENCRLLTSLLHIILWQLLIVFANAPRPGVLIRTFFGGVNVSFTLYRSSVAVSITHAGLSQVASLQYRFRPREVNLHEGDLRNTLCPPKNVPLLPFSISSPNINQYSKFFYWHILWTIGNKIVVKYPTTL